MYKSRPCFAVSSLALACALTTAFTGNAKAGPAPAIWSVTLKGPDKSPLSPDKTWALEMYDAVKCVDVSTSKAINMGGSVPVKLLAREGGGSATRGQLGAHLRWQVWGTAPDGKGGKKTKWWTGDKAIVSDGATPSVVVDLSTGYTAKQSISGNCDKELPKTPIPTPKK